MIHFFSENRGRVLQETYNKEQTCQTGEPADDVRAFDDYNKVDKAKAIAAKQPILADNDAPISSMRPANDADEMSAKQTEKINTRRSEDAPPFKRRRLSKNCANNDATAVDEQKNAGRDAVCVAAGETSLASFVSLDELLLSSDED